MTDIESFQIARGEYLRPVPKRKIWSPTVNLILICILGTCAGIYTAWNYSVKFPEEPKPVVKVKPTFRLQ